MSWQERVVKTPLYEEEDKPSGSPSGEEGEEEGGSPPSGTVKEDPQPQTPTEGEGPFSNPVLKGRFKTEEELAEFLGVQDSVVKSQRQRLNTFEDQRNVPAPAPEPEASGDPKDFFEDPYGAMKKVVEGELKKTIAPLMADLSERKTRGAWDEVSDKYDNFPLYKEAVQERIRSFGIPTSQVTPDLVEEIFLAQVGKSALDGSFSRPVPDRPAQPEARMNPQHRPSSHPPRQEESTKDRELNEDEKKYARMMFRESKDPYGDYLKYSDDQVAMNEDGFIMVEDIADDS
jgi:hypothetical protein